MTGTKEKLMTGDLVLRQARFPDGRQTDMVIRAGRIARIGDLPAGAEAVGPVLDCAGGMIAPGFVDAHIHPGQTFVGGPWVDYDYDDTVPKRARAEAEYLARHGRMNSLKNCYTQFREAIRRGSTHVRGHIDVGSCGLAELEDALEAREAFRDFLDVEYVAFPSNGILNMVTEPLPTLSRAVELGVDVIGGADPCDRDKDPVRSIDLTLGFAKETGCRVDLHLHERGTLGMFTMQLLLDKAEALGLAGRLTFSHMWCLANLSDEEFAPLASRMKALDIRLVTHVPGHVPFPSLRQARRFGLAYGVGTDNMRNLWGPYGMNDMRERVMLLAYLSDFRRREDLEMAYDAGTYGSAAVLGLHEYGLEEGCWADCVVFPQEHRACALLEATFPRFVIKRGRLVAQDGRLSDDVPSYAGA